MFLREQQGLELAGGGTVARSFGRAAPSPLLDSWHDRLARIDWVPDLGANIGSRVWWRGAASCAALCAITVALAPGLHRPIIGDVPPALAGSAWDEARTQAIAPIAFGSATGRRMAANDLVRPLAETPERPIIDLTATLGDGDAFDRVLERAGVSDGDADRVTQLVRGAVDVDAIRPGTRIDLTLGPRADRRRPRPLEKLSFRASFDLNLTLARDGGTLSLQRHPIAIDHTPLRIAGLVGASLYRSARAAGAPAKAVESYIKALATRLSIGRDVSAGDRFDLVIEQQRAATGEVQLGDLEFAGLDQGRKELKLLRWGQDGRQDWYDGDGTIEREGTMGMPVAGHVTSNFGWRMHPLLGFMKLHKGMDIGASYGQPIFAAMDGVVQLAGRAGGYGNFVKLAHAGGLATGYGHMSRIAVRPGERVARGTVIGYVGSTGMSTGPHLHWEVWKNGVSVDPRQISFSSITRLSGDALRGFKAKLGELLAVTPGK